MKTVNDTRHINSAESVLGNIAVIGQKIVVPAFNLNIIEGSECDIFVINKGKYLDFAYIVFEAVSNITWDYEASRKLNPENRECYGGSLFPSGEHTEFWIEYESGYVLIPSYSNFHSECLSIDKPGLDYDKVSSFFSNKEFR